MNYSPSFAFFYFISWLQIFSLSSALSQSLFLASFSFSFQTQQVCIQLQLPSCLYLSVKHLFSFNLHQCNSLLFPCHLSQPFLHLSIFVIFHLTCFLLFFVSTNFLFFSSISFLSGSFFWFFICSCFGYSLYSPYDLSATFTISREIGTLCTHPHTQ